MLRQFAVRMNEVERLNIQEETFRKFSGDFICSEL